MSFLIDYFNKENKKPFRVVAEFKVPYCGWECDDDAAIIQFNGDNDYYVLSTSHGGLRLNVLDKDDSTFKHLKDMQKEVDKSLCAIQQCLANTRGRKK